MNNRNAFKTSSYTYNYRLSCDLYVIGSFMSCHVIHFFLKQVYETKCIEPFIKTITVSERVLTFIIVKMFNINEYFISHDCLPISHYILFTRGISKSG